VLQQQILQDVQMAGDGGQTSSVLTLLVLGIQFEIFAAHQ